MFRAAKPPDEKIDFHFICIIWLILGDENFLFSLRIT